MMRCVVAVAVLASCTLAIPTNTEIMVENPKSFSISSTINEWWGSSAVAKKDTVCEMVTAPPRPTLAYPRISRRGNIVPLPLMLTVAPKEK